MIFNVLDSNVEDNIAIHNIKEAENYEKNFY